MLRAERALIVLLRSYGDGAGIFSSADAKQRDGMGEIAGEELIVGLGLIGESTLDRGIRIERLRPPLLIDECIAELGTSQCELQRIVGGADLPKDVDQRPCPSGTV